MESRAQLRTRAARRRALLMLAALLVASGCAVSPVAPAPSDQLAAALTAPPAARPVSAAALQVEVMDFSDEYVLAIWQGTDDVIRSDPPASIRAAAQYWKVLFSSAAMRIAAGPDPAANLLDMVVFVSLSRAVVQEYWQPQVFGPAAEPLLAALRGLEADIWTMTEPLLAPAQRDALRELVAVWRQDHPRQWYVADVRLDSFAALRGGGIAAADATPDGLLASVQQATRAVDRADLLAERAMFYVERLPRMMTMQTNLTAIQLATMPESQALVADAARLTRAAAQLSASAAALPAQLSAERRAAFDQATAWLATQDDAVRGVLADVRGTLVLANELSTSGNAAIGAIDALLKRQEGQPSDLATYRDLLVRADATTHELNQLLAMLDTWRAADPAHGVDAAARILDQLFWRAVALIVLAPFAIAAALLLYRALAARLWRDSPAPAR